MLRTIVLTYMLITYYSICIHNLKYLIRYRYTDMICVLQKTIVVVGAYA